MGAHSTLRITRSKALATVLIAVTNGVDNDKLGELMDVILYDRLYNCRVVPDGEENDNDRL